MKQFFTIITLIMAAVPVLTATAQTEGFAFGYCGDNISQVGSEGNSNYWVAEAFQMTDEDVSRFDGCEITAVSIGFGSGRNKEVEIFFTYDLSAEPFAVQEGRVRAAQWCDIPISSQTVKVEKGKPFYIGYKYNVTNSLSMPMGFDGNTTSYCGTADWASISETEEGLASNWSHYGDQFGNCCLRVYLKGDNISSHNCVPTGLTMPDLAYPGQRFRFALNFANATDVDVNEIEVVYQVGTSAERTVTCELSTALAANGKGMVELDGLTDDNDFNVPVWARISKVNGEINDMADLRVSATFACTDKYYERKVVAEKFTGIDCGWCPRGIVAFDHMRETYGNKFIGIEVHNYNSSYYALQLRCDAYLPMQDRYQRGGYPSLVVDRNLDLTTQADKGALENAYMQEYTRACPIGVKADFVDGGNTSGVTVSGTVSVAKDMADVDYSLVFVIVEDKCGPYNQNNNYNADQLPEFGGRSPITNMYFDGVARAISADWNGIPNSIPATLTAGEYYTYEVESMGTGKLTDFLKGGVVAMIIDNATGTIVNADLCYFDRSRNPGVSVGNIAPDAAVYVENGAVRYAGEGEAAVYGISGIFCGSVACGESLALAPGAYVVRMADGKTVKVIVK